MLEQLRLIARTRELCHEDPQVEAALMYGSFAKGSGDQYSDVEFALFFTDEAHAALDQRAWLEQIAPLELVYVNRFGITTVIFSSLVRGEFHFYRLSDVAVVETWRGTDWFPSLAQTLLVDKTGQLTPYLNRLVGDPPDPRTPEQLQFAADSLLNWFVFGLSVLERGEYARALDLLSWTHRNLLSMLRATTGRIENYPTPSRLLEEDLEPEEYERFRHCTSSLDPVTLRQAYRHCWTWAQELLALLGWRHGVRYSEALIQGIGRRVEGATRP